MSEESKDETEHAPTETEPDGSEAAAEAAESRASTPTSEPEVDDADEQMRALLHQALNRESEPEVAVLGRVQQRIREASGGKFYEDGWSTSDSPPVATYLITTLVMLAIVIGLYLVLAPISGEPELIETYPAEPVRVVPNRQ